jgi:hypothetical protein
MFGGWTYKMKPELDKSSIDVTSSSSSNSRSNSRSNSKSNSKSSSNSRSKSYYKRRRDKKGRGNSINKRRRKNLTMKSKTRV